MSRLRWVWRWSTRDENDAHGIAGDIVAVDALVAMASLATDQGCRIEATEIEVWERGGLAMFVHDDGRKVRIVVVRVGKAAR